MDYHSTHSSYRERLIEHLFIGKLLKHAWLVRGRQLEIARPEVDNSGYDLIAEERTLVRHLQLKASKLDARTARQSVHTALGSKPSGAVVWILFDADTLALGPFLFFGGLPGEPLPDISAFSIARHTKGNAAGVKAERPAIRSVPKGQFTRYDSATEVYEALFGPS
ncbi:hypothetical protein [Salinicola sp. DM10]|uniref:hypothetical protein n=1 Tax=Salinicola sp. DM10 TaxID=2815721 RepID=UPI001A8DAE4B|nr:hypothetical protein [Salinicola sp. DM10]MCE3028633.1 hypothetical protein [Salinicola sp. DM10]